MNRTATRWIRTYGLWLVLFTLCILLQQLGWNRLLRFDRAAIDGGHLWLLLSAHLVHLSWNHLWLNMGGLLLVVVFFRHYYSVRMWLALLLLSALVVGLGVYFFNTRLQYYVGLSGVLHGLFIAGAWAERRRFPKSGNTLLLLIVVKLVWEQVAGALPGSAAMSGGPVLVDAHLYGAIAGVIFLLLHQVVHVNDRQQDGEYDHQYHRTHGDDQ